MHCIICGEPGELACVTCGEIFCRKHTNEPCPNDQEVDKQSIWEFGREELGERERQYA